MATVADLNRILKNGGTLKPGVYEVSRPLSFASDVTIMAYGATIRMAPDFPYDHALFHNDNEVGGLRVFGLDVRGNGAEVPFTAMIDLPSIRDSVFEGCSFGSFKRHLWAVQKSRALKIRHCLFDDWGADVPGEDGGTALLFFTNDNLHTEISGCTFRNGRWVAIQSQGRWWDVSHNTIEDCCEAGIFIGADSSHFDLNTIRKVSCVTVSGHGMEVGGIGNSFSHNTVEDCLKSGLYFTNPYDVLCDGNIIRDCAHGGEGNAGITVRMTGGPTKVQISNNIIDSDAEYAIALYDWGGAMEHSAIRGNNLRGAIHGPTAGCVVENNVGVVQ